MNEKDVLLSSGFKDLVAFFAVVLAIIGFLTVDFGMSMRFMASGIFLLLLAIYFRKG